MPSDDVIQPGKTPSSSDMFTPAEHRKRYDCADVSRYLKQGRVRGAVPTEDGSFLIPMGALIEYRPTGKQPSFDKRTIKDDMWDILRSCSLKMSGQDVIHRCDRAQNDPKPIFPYRGFACRMRIPFKVAHTIRWRYMHQPPDHSKRHSNAR